jgi:hypothetical protein
MGTAFTVGIEEIIAWRTTMSESERCKECGEIRYDEEGNLDSRIQAGMKCTICAY